MKLYAEYIDFRKAYRIFNSAKPQDTIAYMEEFEEAEQRTIEEGYDGLILCNTDTTHVKEE